MSGPDLFLPHRRSTRGPDGAASYLREIRPTDSDWSPNQYLRTQVSLNPVFTAVAVSVEPCEFEAKPGFLPSHRIHVEQGLNSAKLIVSPARSGFQSSAFVLKASSRTPTSP